MTSSPLSINRRRGRLRLLEDLLKVLPEANVCELVRTTVEELVELICLYLSLNCVQDTLTDPALDEPGP